MVIALGSGVDYGIYLYNRLGQYLQRGLALREAHFETLKTAGPAVAFTGITLAAGVLIWIFSDIKFQADMGLLLTFMFFWNRVGAVVLIPSLPAVMGLGRREPVAGAEWGGGKGRRPSMQEWLNSAGSLRPGAALHTDLLGDD